MAKGSSSRPEPSISAAATALKGRERRLRLQRVRLLKAELAKARERVRVLERELREIGEPEGLVSAGRIRWTDLFEQLGQTFTAKELSAMTGAAPGHVGTVVHGWKTKGWIVTWGRGVYRKAGRRLVIAAVGAR